MREFLCTTLAFTLFISCGTNSKKENLNNTVDSTATYSGVSNEEREYLEKRDSYINQLQKIQKQKSAKDSFDSLYRAEEKAMSELEGKLKTILKGSRFSDKGVINLQTLLGFLGFGLLDGLKFNKDSLRISYTSKNLLFNYVHPGHNQFDKLSPESFEGIFQSAYQFDAAVTNFSFINLHSNDSIKAYGMVAGLAQITGNFTPQYIYVLVAEGDYVYIAEKELKEPVKEIPRCTAVWDSLVRIHEQPVDDTVFAKYCDCYRKDLKGDGQFPAIKKQLESMAAYLEGH